MSQNPLLYSAHDDIAVLTLNAPPVNALGTDMRQQLKAQLDSAFADDSVKAIVLASSQSLFCGGADIQEFHSGDLWGEPDLPSLCALLDDAPKLVVAAINGIAMGGAVELSLGCDYRVGHRSAQLGLPEIKLGLLPGAGGTQRLPRVASLGLALDMILSGNPVSADRALNEGLLDHVVDEGDFLQAVIEFTRHKIDSGAALRHCRDMAVDTAALPDDWAAKTLESMARKSRGQLAPQRCLQSIEAATRLPLDAGLEQERQGFLDLLESDQSRALIHLFFAERQAQKIPGVQGDTPVRSIESAAVLGAGTMGTGITIALLDAGIPVILLDMVEANLSAGLARINNHFQRAVEKGRMDSASASKRVASLSATKDFDDLASVDLVIEAVYENAGIKKAVFEQLDKVCKPGTVLASNTSTLDLNDIAAVTSRPEDVIGTHFFSPANIMKLLEIVRGDQTSPEVIKTVLQLSKRIRKVPVVVGVCYGFAGNRMLEPYFREASRLMLEGASAAQIDRVLTEFGMAMGVISMGDLAGIDIGYRIREERRELLSHDPGYQAIQDKLYTLGRYGQKTGRGCYLYDGREKTDDPEVRTLCKELAAELGIEQRIIEDQEVLERCLYPLVNEGFQILEEGIALRPGDCDIIWTNGYGFPAWRGGPMHYAEQIGEQAVLDGLQKYRQQLGDYGEMWFTPAPLLAQTAGKGVTSR